jgi:hypothetical protein
MTVTRRILVLLLATSWLAAFAHAGPTNYLLGTFQLKCPYCGKVDMVDKGTAQHQCENHSCGKQVFVDGKILVMCPNGHTNEVTLHGETRSIQCKFCKAECEGKWK